MMIFWVIAAVVLLHLLCEDSDVPTDIRDTNDA